MLSVQLFFFLGVIFLLAGTSAPETPGLSASSSLAFGALICLVHLLASWRAFASAHSPGAWFRAERQAFALAFASFVALLYGLDLKYWLQPLTFFDKTEGLADLAGLALFSPFPGWPEGHAFRSFSAELSARLPLSGSRPGKICRWFCPGF